MLRPNLPEGNHKINPLKKIYTLDEFSYLDSIEASPLFQKQAELIMEHGYKNIVDVGCRTGIINNILTEARYEYLYMGFDTSPEPIKWARQRWNEYKNIEYRVADWNDEKSIQVDYDVDCVVFSGVLLYVPDRHFKLFDRLCLDIYNTEGAIIQDLRSDQKHVDNRIEFKYIDKEFDVYEQKYGQVTKYNIDCDFYYGNRIVLDVKIYG